MKKETKTIKRFEDSDAWQVARQLTSYIYSLTRKDRFRRDYGLVDQIRRAAVSVMTNIAEGFERGSNKDFVKFLFIARGSAGEVRSLLYVGLDQEYISQDEFNEAHALCVRCSQVIWGFIQHLRRTSGLLGSATMLPLSLIYLLERFQYF